MLANLMQCTRRTFTTAVVRNPTGSLIQRRIYLTNVPEEASLATVVDFVHQQAEEKHFNTIIRTPGSSHALIYVEDSNDVEAVMESLDGKKLGDSTVSASFRLKMKQK